MAKQKSLKEISASIAQSMTKNLNYQAALEHIDSVELGIQEIDDDFYYALILRQEHNPEGNYLKLTLKIEEAIRFASLVHKGQTRKGKHTPYITHPLNVAELLATVTSVEDIIISGILHDTIEDCMPYKSVTEKTIEKLFNKDIARIVNDVTEQDKTLPWVERKQMALEHITHLKQDALLVKSADVLHNMKDLLTDLEKDGVSVFAKFNAPREAQLERFKKLENALEKSWSNNPLLSEIKSTLLKIQEFE